MKEEQAVVQLFAVWLVTANTDSDWVLIMKRASAIVTDHGGRTSHAALGPRVIRRLEEYYKTIGGIE